MIIQPSLLVKILMLLWVLGALILVPVAADQMVEELNTDYVGNNYRGIQVTTKEDCRDYCLVDGTCYVATFRAEQSQPTMCWLKDKPIKDTNYPYTKIFPASFATITLHSYVKYNGMTFYTTPAGADVYLDGNYEGKSNFSMQTPLGFHKVKFTMPGYQDWVQVIAVTSGPTSNSVNVNLLPSGGGCTGAAPQAEFYGTRSGERPPIAVTFTDQSVGAKTWEWDFGDNFTSYDQNPTHVYVNPGKYTVTLKITGVCPDWSDTEEKVNYIDATTTTPITRTPGFVAIGAVLVLLLFILCQKKRH